MTERMTVRLISLLLLFLLVVFLFTTGCRGFETIGDISEPAPPADIDPVELCQWVCESGEPSCELIGNICDCECTP